MPEQHAQQITDLQMLQKSLKKWRELEEDFAELATDARRRYEKNRDARDNCRAEVVKLERLIDYAILQVGGSPMKKARTRRAERSKYGFQNQRNARKAVAAALRAF